MSSAILLEENGPFFHACHTTVFSNFTGKITIKIKFNFEENSKRFTIDICINVGNNFNAQFNVFSFIVVELVALMNKIKTKFGIQNLNINVFLM